MNSTLGIGFLWYKCPRLGQIKENNVFVMQNTPVFTIFMPYFVKHGRVLGYKKVCYGLQTKRQKYSN